MNDLNQDDTRMQNSLLRLTVCKILLPSPGNTLQNNPISLRHDGNGAEDSVREFNKKNGHKLTSG